MENRAVVIAIGAVSDKIFACFRHNVTVQFQIEWTMRGVQANVALLFDAFVSYFAVFEHSCLRIVDGHHCSRCETRRHGTGRIMCRVKFIERYLRGAACRLLTLLWLEIALQLIQNVPRLGRHHFQSCLRILSFQNFLFGFDTQPLADVMERGNIEFFQRIRILYCDYFFPRERCVIHQIFPILCFDVQLLDGFVGENVARWCDGDNVGILREWLEQRWTVVFALIVSVEVQFDQWFRVAWLACDWIHFECFQKIDDCAQLEDVSVEIAVRYFERGHCNCAKIKRQSFEFDVLIFGRFDFLAAVELWPLRVRQVPMKCEILCHFSLQSNSRHILTHILSFWCCLLPILMDLFQFFVPEKCFSVYLVVRRRCLRSTTFDTSPHTSLKLSTFTT